MKDLSLEKRFAILTLNGMEVSRGVVRKHKERCLAAAVYAKEFLNGTCSVEQWMKKSVEASKKECQKLTETIVQELIEEDLLDIVPALISCDVFLDTAGVKVEEYRASTVQYHGEVELLRAEILEGEELDQEIIVLMWLLSQSGDFGKLFTPLEADSVKTRMNQIYVNNSYAHDILSRKLGSDFARGWEHFLEKKQKAASFGFIQGVAAKVPMLQRDESIFIATEKYFEDAHTRLQDIKNVLESKGHICEIRIVSEVPLVEIDNVLYHLVPDGIIISRVPIQGVRLRRYNIY